MNNQIKYSLNLLKQMIDSNQINLNKRIDEITEENSIVLSSLASRIDNLELIISKLDGQETKKLSKTNKNNYNLSELNKKIEKIENDISMLQIKKNISMNITKH